MILHSYKFFVHYYINNIIIFSKILEDHFQYLNMIFNLFNKLEIIFKRIKTHLDYLLIILLDQQVNNFDIIFSKKQIAVLQDLSFSETLKNLKIYLDLTE